jgi:serpin B
MFRQADARSRRLGQVRYRFAGAIAAAAILAGACGSSAKQAPNGTPIASPTPTSPGWSAGPAWSMPPRSASPSSTPAPLPSFEAADFELATGTMPRLSPADDEGSAAAAQINDFGFDLLRRLDSSGNVVASPTSIALALAMVRPGARGTTATEMDRVLHSFGADGQESEIVALLNALQLATTYDDSEWYSDDPLATPDHTGQQPATELRVADQAFAQKGMPLEQAYLNALSSRFGAGLGILDFRSDPEAARQAINSWASDQTKGRIPEVLQPNDINTLTRIALANAIYLKAGWSHPFDPKSTTLRPFTTAAGTQVSVPTMAIHRTLAYAAGSGYRAVSLGYGEAPLEMVIVVPDNMASFISGLSNDTLDAIVEREGQGYYDVDLTLPRFSAETRLDLKATLVAMGMPTAFDQNTADLTGITSDPANRLFLAKVIHQANIDVVEEGTTASAVTVVIGQAAMGDAGEPTHVQFKVDKPFLYFIRETGSGALLFMGRIDDPSK